MEPSDMPWKLSQSKTLNGYTFRIESADGLTIGEFYGSTNPMWDSVPGARQAQENARLVIDASCRIAELEKQLAEKDAEIERLKSSPPEKREDLRCVISDICAQVRERGNQLAASQAREQQLLSVIEAIKWCGYTRLSPRSHMLIKDAICKQKHTATETNLKALHESHQYKMQHEIDVLRKELSRLMATGIGQIMSDTAAKAGEVMRERCAAYLDGDECFAYFMGSKAPGSLFSEAISSLPGVTLEDLKD